MDFIFNNEFLEHKRINTLSFRSHYIPFKKNDVPLYYRGAIIKESSSEVISLNGEWNFKAYPKYQDFLSLDYHFKKKERIDVPSCVQCRGYDFIQYLNIDYPFPFNPPFIDKGNPLFHYQKYINIQKRDNFYIVFEGVDNAFYLFVNNQKVGYSCISHSKSEFDITPYLKDGENKIDVLVLKWSFTSYFECQDKFRFSGIFRDVYLLNRKKNHIKDYRFKTRIEGDDGVVTFLNKSDVDILLKIKKQEYLVSPYEEKEIKIKNAKKWNHEHPYLYNFSLSYDDEIIYEKIGIREISVTNGVFKINGQHLKLKGVNRHETHPYNGMSVTKEDTYKDLKLMKDIGVNAIRTSHYPDIPEFYELCDHMGFYVLDEADLETHGADHYTGEYNHELWREFADKSENEYPIYLREKSLFERDKNRTCVVIFSLGNESSFGKAFYKGLDYLKENSDRPIHYEGVFNALKEDYYDSRIDFASRMYASPQALIDEHLNDPREYRPIILCEYSHAMGNSNGDLKDYWDVINSSNRFVGGFVWEWCDHALMVNGKLHYGGDSNNLPNDGNFCVDGLVTPFRKYKSNTLELKAIYHDKYIEDTPIDKTKDYHPPYQKKNIILIGDDKKGEIKSILVDGLEVFDGGIKLNFLRAPLDNDREETESFTLIENSQRVIEKVVKDKTSITYYGHLFNKEKILSFNVKYSINNGFLETFLKYSILKDDILFPRVGITFKLYKKCHKYTFFGYGPDESYIDKHIHNKMGEFVVYMKNSMSPNLKPQECGSHYYSSYVNVNDLFISADHPFSFSVLPYSLKTLKETKHDYELINKDEGYVSLDIAHSGVGTHSCGPRLDKKYWIPKEASNTFKIYFK